MSWRWQLPVRSPVSPRALGTGLRAAIGLQPSGRDSVANALRRRYSAGDALLTDSGTSALVLALRALVRPGGKIGYPGYACIDLTAAAVKAGVHVRLYDLDPLTLSPDLESVERLIRRGVDAIVVAHLYGYPADLTAVQTLASREGIPVIEDAAQGAGGTLNGTRLGALGDISILSFGRGKGTTAGSGGAVLVRTPTLAEWAGKTRETLDDGRRGASEVTALAAQWLFGRPSLYRLPASIPVLKLGEMVYHSAGEPRAISTAAAAILPSALLMDEREFKHRRSVARLLLSRVRTSNFAPVRSVATGESGFLRLAILDSLGTASPNSALGAVRGYPLMLDQHDELRPILVGKEKSGPGAAELRDKLFTLPTHSGVAQRDVDKLSQWLARS